ncbi:TAP-like protein [Amycolatopsis rubida]|uniref:TAP-like protein n=1 Tax=Amycolatopsis rubida TaxID=112413 RepID=A0A1I5JED3_9PSEU|nr:TAP-like protein [Amycolatopsis rubida]
MRGLKSASALPYLTTRHTLLNDQAAPAGSLRPAARSSEQSQRSTMISVLCGDNAWPRSISTYQRNVTHDRVKYPMLGGAAANVWPCAHWAKQPLETPVQFSDQGPSNLLLVQNLRDPATPLSARSKPARSSAAGREWSLWTRAGTVPASLI